LYQRVLALIASDPASGDLSNLRMRAQSLAHLGEGHEAVRVIQEALREDPENAWTFFAAAVVYTAIGERTSALVNVRQAAAKGVQPRWFGIRLFDTLRDDPEFVALLGQDPVVSRSD
jgi:serine/threonine-protein kinase